MSSAGWGQKPWSALKVRVAFLMCDLLSAIAAHMENSWGGHRS